MPAGPYRPGIRRTDSGARATAAEQLLEGKEVTTDLIREAGELAVEAASPISDVRGSVEYRKELVKVLTRRTLSQCMESLGHSV